MTEFPDTMPEHMAGKPTYFVEKIINSIQKNDLAFINLAELDYHLGFSLKNKFGNLPQKIHTIRRDGGNRWKPGMMIDFWINYRTKKQFRFAPRIPSKDTPKIEIIYKTGIPIINLEEKPDFQDLEQLTQNDGFDSVDDFFAWFNKDFSGVIISWSDIKY